MCGLWNIALESVTEKCDRGTDRRRTKWSLCVTMLRRWHNKWIYFAATVAVLFYVTAEDISVTYEFILFCKAYIKILFHRMFTKFELKPCQGDMEPPSSFLKHGMIMRIKNDLEFLIGKYQSRATCFDIILTEAWAEVWMSKHVARDWYFPIWNERSFLILFLAEYWQ